MKHLLSFLACGLLLHTLLQGMEKQRLLSAHSHNRSTQELQTAVSMPGSYQNAAPKSETLIELVKRRNPHEDPFFALENRDKNLALVKSIGAHNTTAKMALLAALFFALNGAKDVISMGYWGGNQIFPTTDLIPPSHLMNLQPCYQICQTIGCMPLDPDCIPVTVCSDAWDCSGGSSVVLNTLGKASCASLAVNGVGLAASLLIGLRACTKAGQNEKELQKVLGHLLDLTDDGIAKESKVKTPSVNPVQEILDKQLVQYIQSDEQQALDAKRKALIAQITETGSLDAKWKMCAVLTAIFGANLVKDATLGFLWGIDTTYPLTPLIHNFSSPLMPCKQVCWQSGCCGMECIHNAPCLRNCDLNCVDIQSSPNAFGYTSAATMLANFAGMITSGLLAFRYYTQHTKADTVIEDELKKLDGLIASDTEAIN